MDDALRLERLIRSLVPGDVEVRAGRVSELQGDVHPRERAAVARAVDRRREEFTAGRSCARSALRALGCPDAERALLPDADRVPRWPRGFSASISHGGGWCAAIAARSAAHPALGLDLEIAGPLEPELRETICAADELEQIEALPGSRAAEWLRVAFSAKEAFYKAHFPLHRVRLDFRDVHLSLDAGAGRFLVEPQRPEIPGLLDRRESEGRFAVDHPWVCCVVAAARA